MIKKIIILLTLVLIYFSLQDNVIANSEEIKLLEIDMTELPNQEDVKKYNKLRGVDLVTTKPGRLHKVVVYHNGTGVNPLVIEFDECCYVIQPTSNFPFTIMTFDKWNRNSNFHQFSFHTSNYSNAKNYSDFYKVELYYTGEIARVSVVGASTSFDNAKNLIPTNYTFLTSINLTPTSSTLRIGQTQYYTVTARYSDGTSKNITDLVTWDVSNNDIATIDQNGKATALSKGATIITATYQGMTAKTTLTVIESEPPPDPTRVAERLEVFPKNATIKKDETKEFRATIYYTDGSSRDVTNEVNWTVANNHIASIENGKVTALDEGETTITATYLLNQNVSYMSGSYFNTLTNQSFSQNPAFFVQNTSLSDTANIKVKVPIIDKIKKFIDSIFRPVHSFLDLAIEQLRKASTVTAQGLNVGQYLRIFGDLPGPWQLVVYSLMISMGLIGGIFIFRSIMRIYYALKEGVKWW